MVDFVVFVENGNRPLNFIIEAVYVPMNFGLVVSLAPENKLKFGKS